MAFVCTLLEDEDHFRVHKEGDETGRSAVARTVIGYDDVPEVIYYASVMIDVLPGGNDMELRFCIDEYDGQTNTFFAWWRGNETTFIGKEHRKLVLSAIVNLASHLVSTMRPEVVLMVANDASVTKAGRKHFLIAKMCERLGYKIKTFDAYNGQRVWRMVRMPDSAESAS
jgi:hypothetical protein